MAVIVTYDENGGFWDHVPPPSGPGWGDRWGPGTRVPTIIVSPFAKRGYVDKTPYDTTVDPQAHHAPLRARAAARRAREARATSPTPSRSDRRRLTFEPEILQEDARLAAETLPSVSRKALSLGSWREVDEFHG